MDAALNLTDDSNDLLEAKTKDIQVDQLCIRLTFDMASGDNLITPQFTRSIHQYSCNNSANFGKYLKSDDNTPLLILVKFKQKIDMEWLRIHSFREDRHYTDQHTISAPNKVEIYKVMDLDVTHDKIRSTDPDVSIICTKKSITLNEGQKIDLQNSNTMSNKFKQTECIAIYFANNQNNTPKTFLTAITFYGHLSEKIVHNTTHSTGTIMKFSDKETIQQTIDSKYLFEPETTTSDEKQNEEQNCPQEHGLISFCPTNHACDFCEKEIQNYELAWGCRQCNYDLCRECYGKKCELSKCTAMTRMVSTLKTYMAQQLKSHSIKENQYNNVEVLNYFNHLLLHHKQDKDFENIYDILLSQVHNGQQCPLSNCAIMRRNYRDRSRDDISYHQLYHSNDAKCIATQQILDRIHCHYLHTFDIGYRLKQQEKELIINDEIKGDDENNTFDRNVFQISELINKKQNTYTKIKGLERLSNTNNKFVTDMEKQKYSVNIYSFGHRYFYWKYYEESTDIYDDAHTDSKMCTESRPKANDGAIPLKDWYIPPKYKNLKEEILKNALCNLNKTEWTHLTKKAKIHSSTDQAKEMECIRIESAKFYEMEESDPVTKKHIIAIMIYCNYDVLQSKFTETFRRLHEHESNASLIKRHHNYHHLGKLLRELTECFGSSFSGDIIDVYHGVDKPFTFASMAAYIKGPFSTSLDYSVAANFCNNKGIILNVQFSAQEFRIEEYESPSACFDCHLISDFSSEREIFFIGGLYRFEIKTIIDSTINANYDLYIKGLRQLDNCTSIDGLQKAGWFDEDDSTDKQIIYRLLSHEIYRYFPNHLHAHQFKTCPEYFKHILHSHCKHVNRVVFNNYPNKIEVFEEIFKDDNGWIDLKLITTVFPSVEGIGFNWKTGMIEYAENIKKSTIYHAVLLFLKCNYKTTSLKLINIRIDPLFALEMSNYVQKYQRDYAKYGWTVYVVTENITSYVCISTIKYSKQGKIMSLYAEDVYWSGLKDMSSVV